MTGSGPGAGRAGQAGASGTGSARPNERPENGRHSQGSGSSPLRSRQSPSQETPPQATPPADGTGQAASEIGQTAQPKPPARRGLMGFLRNVWDAGRDGDWKGDLRDAFDSGAADRIDAQRSGPPAGSRTDEATRDEGPFNADKFANDYQGNNAIRKGLKAFLQGLKNKNIEPDKEKMEMAKECLEKLEEREDYKELSQDGKNALRAEVFEAIARSNLSENNADDIFDIAQQCINDRAERGKEVLEELTPCFQKKVDGEMKPRIDKKGRIIININELNKIKDGLSEEAQEKYDAFLNKFPEEMHQINKNTAHLHFALLSAAKAGNELRQGTQKELQKFTQNAIDEKGPYNMDQDKFFDMMEKTLGIGSKDNAQRKLQEQVDGLQPQSEEERKELTEQLVGDGKMFNQEEWDKLSDDEKKQQLAGQKQENQLMDILKQNNPHMHNQLKNMPPKERRNHLERMLGENNLGTPAAMNAMNQLNGMSPEDRKRAMEGYQKAVEAQQNAMQKQNDHARNIIDNNFKNFQDSITGMTKGLEGAASAVQNLASAIGSMRQRLAQQAQQAQDASDQRQQQMMDQNARRASQGSGMGGH